VPYSTPVARLARLAAWILALAVLPSAPALAGKLVVYSSADPDVLRLYGEAFSKAHPQVQIEWMRDSTGALQQRILAEKDKLRADVILAHTASNLAALGQAGMLQPYAPKGFERVAGRFLDRAQPPKWVGLYGWSSALCVNTGQARAAGLAVPAKWADLLNPAYKGRLTMPSPATSGTGALMLTGWVRMWGEEKAWAFMDRLHDNVRAYTRSGTRPCEQAAAGETVVGLSFPGRGARLKAAGSPIDIVVPEEGIGWDLQAAAIVKGTRNLKDAQVLMDWAISQGAMEEYARYGEVTSVRVRVKKLEHLPANISEKMVALDFDWVAREQPRLIAEWTRRYGTKAEAAAK
jgi:iron(III) transport system substrate-binding protein